MPDYANKYSIVSGKSFILVLLLDPGLRAGNYAMGNNIELRDYRELWRYVKTHLCVSVLNYVHTLFQILTNHIN